MARIPDASDLGERRVIEPAGPVSTDNSADLRAEGVTNAMESISRGVKRYQQQDDEFNYARARTFLNTSAIAMERKLAEEPDYEKHEANYRTEMQKAREDAGKLIRGNRSRALFEDQAQFDIERGLNEVRIQAKIKEGNQGRADLEELLEVSRRAMLESDDPEQRAALMDSVSSGINGALAKGYITPEMAGDTERRWTQNFGESVVAMMPPDRQIELLKSPDGTPAEFIDPAKRSQMLAIAENNAQKAVVGQAADVVLNAYSIDSKAGEAALGKLSSSGLSTEQQREVSGAVREGLGLLHFQRRQEYAPQVNALERSIAVEKPSASAEEDANRLYRRGVYSPEQYTNLLQAIDVARQKAAKKTAELVAVDEAIVNGLRLDPRDTDVVKSVDTWFNENTRINRIEPGSDEWINTAATIAKRTNILPPEAMSWARKTILSGEPDLAVPAANAMSRFADAAPAAYAFFDDAQLKANAEAIDSMVRAGVDPKKAVEIAHANTYDIPKPRQEALASNYTREKHAADNAGELQSLMNSDDAFDRNIIGGAPAPSVAMRDEYSALVRRYFDFTNGDIKRSRELAWKDIRGTYGVSTVNGEPEVLKYAPEIVFPGIDPAVIRSDIESAAKSLGVETKVNLSPANVTGDTHGLMWELSTIDADGNVEILLDEKNRPYRYAIPTDTRSYVEAQEEAKRKAIESAREEGKRRRAAIEAIDKFDPLKNEMLQ
jgi:hypothetical protein